MRLFSTRFLPPIKFEFNLFILNEFVPKLENCSPNVAFIDSAKAVSRRTKDVLMLNNILNINNDKQQIDYFTSGSEDFLKTVIREYL